MHWRERARVGLLCALGMGYSSCTLVADFEQISGKPWSGTTGAGVGGAVSGDGTMGTSEGVGGSGAIEGGSTSSGESGSMVILATGQMDVESIAVDASYVYWVSAPFGKFMKVSIKGDGQPIELIPSGCQRAQALLIDDRYAYWATGDGIRYASILMPTTTPQTFLSKIGVRELALDPDYIYWVSPQPPGAIQKTSRANGSVKSVVNEARTSFVAIDNLFVYWTDAAADVGMRSVKKTPLSGGSTTVLAATLSEPNLIMVDDKYVYWTDVQDNHVSAVPKENGGTVMNSGPTPLTPYRIAQHDNFIFWITQKPEGFIWKLQKGDPLSSHPPFPLIRELPPLKGLAVDAKYVYVSTEDGRILRISR